MDYFSEVKIILVETSHPGNIGSVARAMKTMGFSNLNLVNPLCKVNEISYAMASNAGDILDNLRIYKDLHESIGECKYIVGATARQRDIPLEIINPREFATKLKPKGYKNLALIFGNEARGLTNEQLSLCTLGLHIPSNKDYTSLNIASSVQVILYELLVESEYDASDINKFNKNDIAPNKMLNGFLEHMDKVLKDIDFIKNDGPMITRKINHIFKKANLTEEEINILRGILSAIENHSQ